MDDENVMKIKLSSSEIEALYNFMLEEGDSIYELTQECNCGLGCSTVVVNISNSHETDITDYDVW